MLKNLTAEDVLRKIRSGEFDELRETVEDQHVEFKGAPYALENDNAKLELAKDVSALANASGGVILIGFPTVKDEMSSIEYVEACRPFDLAILDIDRYRKILDDWISPPIHSIEILCVPSPVTPERGVAVISVPGTASAQKPYLVNRNVEADGKVRGTQFGYYERVQDRIPAASAATLSGLLRDGMRFAEIARRLDTIEAFLGNYVSENESGITESELSNRISEAETSVDRQLRPNLILAATSKNPCSFPELFKSRSSNLVKLLDNPPLLREQGFAITPWEGVGPSEIIRGRLRRRVANGNRLFEVWQDGAVVTVGPGDEDLLCWFMRNQTNPKPGLPIRNFVLAEVTLNFCRLAVEIFKNAVPIPSQISFTLSLNNMTEDGVPCKLSTRDDSGPYAQFVGHGPRDASASTVSSRITLPFDNLDAGNAAYELLGGIYTQFGFN